MKHRFSFLFRIILKFRPRTQLGSLKKTEAQDHFFSVPETLSFGLPLVSLESIRIPLFITNDSLNNSSNLTLLLSSVTLTPRSMSRVVSCP